MTSKCGKNKRGAHEVHKIYFFLTNTLQVKGASNIVYDKKDVAPKNRTCIQQRDIRLFSIRRRFDLACDYVLVGCFGLNSENISVPQSILDGYFCGIFITSELYIPRLFTSWTTQNDLTS